MKTTLFGREPAMWIAAIEALLALGLSVGLNLGANQVTLIMALVVAVFAVYTAYVTSNTTLAVIVGLLKAVFACFVGFGVDLSPEFTGAAIALVTVLLGWFNRDRTAPLAHGSFKTEGLAVASGVETK